MTPFNKETEEEFNKEFENVRWDSHKGTGDILTFINARVAKRTEDIREAVEKACPLPTWDVPEATDVMPTDPEVAADQCRIATVKSALSAINKLNDDAPAS